jgi:two-component system, chemotaxis family, sensor kinase CheA
MALDRMESGILRQYLLAVAYADTGDESSVAGIAAERLKFDESKLSLSAIWRDKADLDEAVFGEYADFVGLADSFMAAAADRAKLGDSKANLARLASAGGREAGLRKDLTKGRDALLADFDRRLRGPLQNSLAVARGDAASAAWRSLIALGALTLAAVAIGIALGIRMMRQIREPIGKLVDGMNQIASGDRAARLEDVGVAEFEELESGFNDMAERLEEAEGGLMRSYGAQRRLLDEIPVGFLTIGPDFRVGPEFSKATERILGKADIAGASFSGLLFPVDSCPEAEGLRRYLKQLFENTTADKDFLDEMNPVVAIALRGADGERDVAIGFDRLYEGDRVTDVLATIEDRTETIAAEQALEEERRSRRRDSDSIQAILSIGPGPLKDFFTETRESVVRIREYLGRLVEAENIHACFRLLHSVKGAAGSFGIESIAMSAHEAEGIFAEMRESGRAPTTQELVRINVLLGMMGEELDAFEDLVMRLKATLARLEDMDARGEERNELAEFLATLPPMVEQLRKSLAKPIDLALDIQVDELPHLREMRTAIIHLIRNSADHGLEDEYERLFQGKEKAGKITLCIRRKEGNEGACIVEVEDDGQGINFDRIAERGIEAGFLPKGSGVPDRQRLLSLLFRPGFSTKDKVDEISGRGVGLDCVRDIVKSLDGRIAVSSTRGRGTKFSLTIPIPAPEPT